MRQIESRDRTINTFNSFPSTKLLPYKVDLDPDGEDFGQSELKWTKLYIIRLVTDY